MSGLAAWRAAAAPVLRRLLSGDVARDSVVLFGGYVTQLLLQVGWLVMALRVLGPEGYAIFVGLTAITMAAGCLAGFGCDQLLIRNAAADPDRLRAWTGHGILAIGASGLPICAIVVPLLLWLEPTGVGVAHMLGLAVADVVLGRWAGLTVAVYMASGRAVRQSLVAVMAQACRLGAIVAAAALPEPPTIQAWILWYTGAIALSALLCLGLVVRDHGWPKPGWIGGQLRDGLAFGTEGALQAALKDFDKPLVLAMLGPAAAGAYAAALRIVDALTLPVRSVGYAIYPRLFAAEAKQADAADAFARRMLPAVAGLGAAAGLAGLLGAGLIGMAFPRYAELPLLLRILTPMPALLGIYVLGADLLSVQGRQTIRLGLVILLLGLMMAGVWLGALAGVAGATVARLLVMAAAGALAWALCRRKRPA